jgi:hypothetical protein
MQALGAYGFLGYQRGRREFLAHIPTAVNRLRLVACRISGLERFAALLEQLQHGQRSLEAAATPLQTSAQGD